MQVFKNEGMFNIRILHRIKSYLKRKESTLWTTDFDVIPKIQEYTSNKYDNPIK